MFTLQAEQINGAWYTLASYATRREATNAMWERGGWKSGRVRYRILS